MKFYIYQIILSALVANSMILTVTSILLPHRIISIFISSTILAIVFDSFWFIFFKYLIKLSIIQKIISKIKNLFSNSMINTNPSSSFQKFKDKILLYCSKYFLLYINLFTLIYRLIPFLHLPFIIGVCNRISFWRFFFFSSIGAVIWSFSGIFLPIFFKRIIIAIFIFFKKYYQSF